MNNKGIGISLLIERVFCKIKEREKSRMDLSFFEIKMKVKNSSNLFYK